MKTILAFDTSTAACSAALMIGDTCISRFELAPRRHTELLLGQVDELLVEAGTTLTAVDAIAVGYGPGSFMGVRLAVSVAQGLAYAANRPVVPISSLRALAQTLADQTAVSSIVAGWDARMQELYWGTYTVDPQGIVQLLGDDRLSKPGEVAISAERQWCAVGNAWEVYEKELPQEAFFKRVAKSHTDLYPTAVAVAKLGMYELIAGKEILPLILEPLYLRNKVTY